MSRETLLSAARLEATSTPLGGEIEHHTHVDGRDYAYDEVSALFDAYAFAENETKDLRVIRRARELLIEHGFYRIMPPEEIANTWHFPARTAWDFKLKKQPYTTDYTINDWQWPEEIAQ